MKQKLERNFQNVTDTQIFIPNLPSSNFRYSFLHIRESSKISSKYYETSSFPFLIADIKSFTFPLFLPFSIIIKWEWVLDSSFIPWTASMLQYNFYASMGFYYGTDYAHIIFRCWNFKKIFSYSTRILAPHTRHSQIPVFDNAHVRSEKFNAHLDTCRHEYKRIFHI